VGEAFFKAKLNGMLTGILRGLVARADKDLLRDGPVDIGETMNKLVSSCATVSVFGLDSADLLIDF